MILNQQLADYQVILASLSPRRRELLKGMGINFECCVLDIVESFPPHLMGKEIPEYLAELKANAYNVEKMSEKSILITADTIVWMNGQMLGKPIDRDDAIRIIGQLSGNMHQVFTGVCLSMKNKRRIFSAESNVYFRSLSHEEICWYVDQNKPYDKAGAYGVQEWIGYIGIERIEGSYFNVMGLPTQMLYRELIEFLD